MGAIDLNADLGETVDGVPTADDAGLFAVISSASVACGGHAGDAASMREAVARAAERGVAVGGHPSYPDRAGFGRARLAMSAADVRLSVVQQLGALVEAGANLRYVKPHGALYHSVRDDRELADAVAAAVADVSGELGRSLPILGLSGEIEGAAVRVGVGFLREAFLDRGYRADGSLVPRGQPGDLLHDPACVAERAVRLVNDGVVVAVDGSLVRTDAVSLCVHGDSPGAVRMARAVREALTAANIDVRAPW